MGLYTCVVYMCAACFIWYHLHPTPRGSTPASSTLGHVQALATLTWLILASMREWAAGEATNSDPLTPTLVDVHHHTSTVVIHLLEHVSPEHFVQQVAAIVRDAISRLAQHGTGGDEEIKTVFVFIQVWYHLHDVETQGCCF